VIAGKTWRETRFLALAYLLILEGLTIPVLLLWPEIYSDLQRSSLLTQLGIDFLKRIGEGVSNRDENVAYLNWCAVMLFFRGANLVGTAAAVLFGTGLFARERENQTFEFLLARPVSRTRLLWQKYWPAAVCVVTPLFVVNASAILWSRVIDLDLPKWELFLASVHAAVFALCFLTATTWVSILLRVQAHTAAVVGAFAVVQIGVYLTQRIRQYSLFHLADFEWYGPILAGNTPAWQMFDPIRSHGYTTWLSLAALGFYGLAWRALRRAEP
jgi:ABC-type transport system involved in multi-copper enzyme maturation permease subunit